MKTLRKLQLGPKLLFFSLSITSNIKKKKKKTEKNGQQLEQVEICVVLSCHFPSPAAEAPGIEKLSSCFTRWGKNIPEDKGGKKADILLFSIRKRLKMTKAFCLSCFSFVLFFFLLRGKCCSSLLTLPGAHPVCEILNMKIVPLCSDEMMMIHSF